MSVFLQTQFLQVANYVSFEKPLIFKGFSSKVKGLIFKIFEIPLKFKGNISLTFEVHLNIKILPFLRSSSLPDISKSRVYVMNQNGLKQSFVWRILEVNFKFELVQFPLSNASPADNTFQSNFACKKFKLYFQEKLIELFSINIWRR